jgi:hypothetical protein
LFLTWRKYTKALPDFIAGCFYGNEIQFGITIFEYAIIGDNSKLQRKIFPGTMPVFGSESLFGY